MSFVRSIVLSHRVVAASLPDVVPHKEAKGCRLILLQIRLILGLH